MSHDNDPPMTTGDWFFTLLLLAIPVLNLILYIVWASGSGNRSRVTFCRASIIWLLIGVGIYAALLAFGFGASLGSR
jgi:hypothetical protein